ncbi:MAG: metallophosphoesterase [Geobacteraceae bacterium]|nr:metallophosphoesterase [Geobacteraceae bacterium]
MRTTLTWLHISDIHFHNKTEWRDGTARDSLLNYLKQLFHSDESKRPDIIFCTGDIAYGETGSSSLAEQYDQAKVFFNELREVCGQVNTPLPIERLYVVPGNHDINRNNVNSDAQATLTHWAGDSTKHINDINQRFNDRNIEFTDTIKRLEEYANFVQTYLPHQHDHDTRHRYTSIVDIEGLKVGVAGFNSAWSCAGPEDDRNVWLAPAHLSQSELVPWSAT